MKNKTELTKKQHEIIQYLAKYRFITTNQFQQLFNHKDPHRIKVWLIDLMEKKYVKRYFDRASFQTSNKPAVYFLTLKARVLLKAEGKATTELEYIYKEHTRTEKFITHNLLLVDVYLFMNSHRNPHEEVKFFTKVQLRDYEHFPSPLPDAFIAVKTNTKTRRYFLDIIDDHTPSWAARRRIKQYLSCAESLSWSENTSNSPFPSILLIFHNDKLLTHIYAYTASLLEKSLAEYSIFLTTTKLLKLGVNETLWKKVT